MRTLAGGFAARLPGGTGVRVGVGFPELVELAGRIMERTGVVVIVGGAAVAVAVAALVALASGGSAAYTRLRQDLGRAILLGLEFLVGGDIIRTVSEVPTLDQVAALAGVVLIRTLLSVTLEVELEGRWPWRRSGENGASA